MFSVHGRNFINLSLFGELDHYIVFPLLNIFCFLSFMVMHQPACLLVLLFIAELLRIDHTDVTLKYVYENFCQYPPQNLDSVVQSMLHVLFCILCFWSFVIINMNLNVNIYLRFLWFLCSTLGQGFQTSLVPAENIFAIVLVIAGLILLALWIDHMEVNSELLYFFCISYHGLQLIESFKWSIA